MNLLANELKYNILLRLNYADTLSMCHTSKEILSLCTNFFWKEKTLYQFSDSNRYLSLNNETDKNRYLRIATNHEQYYRGSENYVNLNFIANNITNVLPQDYNYFLAKLTKNDLNNTVEKALLSNNMNLFWAILLHGADNYNEILIWASKSVNTNVVKYIMDRTNEGYGEAIIYAVGHYEIFNLLMTKIQSDKTDVTRNGYLKTADYKCHDIYSQVLIRAISISNNLIVKKILDYSYCNSYKYRYTDAILLAAKLPSYNIFNLLFDYINNNYCVKDNSLGTVTYKDGFSTDYNEAILKSPSYGGDINITYNKVMNSAAAAGKINIVKIMLEHGATDYNSTMIEAVAAGKNDIIKLMLGHGATNYNSTMIEAAKFGNIEIIKLMLEKGATDYNSAMIEAAKFGNIDIVTLMLEKGATDYNSAIKLSGINSHINIVKLVIIYQNNNLINLEDSNYILLEATLNGDIDMVKLMLKEGAMELNKPMYHAASKGYINIVKLLIEYGANDYNTSAEHAAANSNIDIVKIMLEKGATNYGNILVEASLPKNDKIFNLGFPSLLPELSRRIEIIKLMLEKGVNIYTLLSGDEYDDLDVEDEDEYNDLNVFCVSLRNAAEGSIIEVVKMLLENGANNYNYAMRHSIIFGNGNVDVIQLLLNYGANDYELIITAAQKGHIAIVKLLISIINESKFYNWKSLYNKSMREAVINNYVGISRILLKAGADDYN